MNLTAAIVSLCPEAEFILENDDYSNIRWLVEPTKIPTLQELETEKIRLKDVYSNNEYQRLRKPEYPSIGDQLDDLYHSGFFSEEMRAKIQAVKDKYPKT